MSKQLNTKDIFVWCSELSLNSGEGILALQFIKDLKKNFNNKIIVRTPYEIIHNFDNKKILDNNHYNHIKKTRYFYTFVGLIYCWIYFLKKKKMLLHKLFAFVELIIIYFVTSKYNFRTYYWWS
jgi:hypothetical protein